MTRYGRTAGALVRWWVYRGWAFSASVLLAVPAVALQPPYPVEGSGLPSQIGFALAATAYFGLGCWPEWTHLRRTASVLGTFTTALRALTLLLDDTLALKVRAVGVAAWLLAMLFLACAPEFTERYTRGGAGWYERS